jgi:vacuolar-type H+-ATPase subunit E/Vma4
MPNHRKRNTLSNEEQQLDEMVNALQQVIGVSEHKARLETQQEVVKLIKDGLDKNHSPFTILSDLTIWAGGKK